MKSTFRDQGIIVLLAEISRLMECSSNNAHSLELSPRITYCFFVDGKSLRKELITDFFSASLVSYLTTGDEETQAEFGGAWYASVEC